LTGEVTTGTKKTKGMLMGETAVGQKQEVFLPYGRQHVTDSDVEAVVEVLRSDWLTQGPTVPAFESKLAASVGAAEAVACSSGTAALHLAMLSIGLRDGDAVVVPSNTFLASANCARYVGAEVRFADVDPNSGLINTDSLRELLEDDTTRRIKAVIPVHFSGQPADLPTVHTLAKNHGAYVVDDACHALGARYNDSGDTHQIGGSPHADLTVFSFHPVKHVATGEGGAITTQSAELAECLRLFRNHGMQKGDFVQEEMAFSDRAMPNPWYYEMQNLGYNYRLTDIQAALGGSQIERLQQSVDRRNELASEYGRLIAKNFDPSEVRPLEVINGVINAYHLFVVLIDFRFLGLSRASVMNELRAEGIGTQVHYIPVHLQPYYRRVCKTSEGDLPGAEMYYRRALSLPMYPELSQTDIERVVDTLHRAIHKEL
jgi:UDP-4-amino-4,6-dideoxy-N-acetyl-beta-L-altrosamine transaminase